MLQEILGRTVPGLTEKEVAKVDEAFKEGLEEETRKDRVEMTTKAVDKGMGRAARELTDEDIAIIFKKFGEALK